MMKEYFFMIPDPKNVFMRFQNALKYSYTNKYTGYILELPDYITATLLRPITTFIEHIPLI